MAHHTVMYYQMHVYELRKYRPRVFLFSFGIGCVLLAAHGSAFGYDVKTCIRLGGLEAEGGDTKRALRTPDVNVSVLVLHLSHMRDAGPQQVRCLETLSGTVY